MSDENIKTKAINLMKLQSVAFIDSINRTEDEKTAVASANIFLEEFTDEILSEEYKSTIEKVQIKPTKLSLSDFNEKRECAGLYDVSCKSNELSDQHVKEFVSYFDKNKKKSDSQENAFATDLLDSVLDSIDGPVNLEDTIFDAELDVFDTQIDDKMEIPKSQKPQKVYSIFSQKPVKEKTTASFNNPFKRVKIDQPNSHETNSLRESIQKMENKMSQNTDVNFIDKTDKINTQRFKMSNPWREERMNKATNGLEEFPNQFESKSSKIQAKENCSVRNPFEKAEKQHSTKLNPFKIDKEEEKKIDTKQVDVKNPFSAFKTANQELEWQKNLQMKPPPRGLSRKRAPMEQQDTPNSDIDPLKKKFHCPSYSKNSSNTTNDNDIPNELKGFDQELIKRIQREIVVDGTEVSWDDIIGLDGAKKVIKESVILAIRRPDLFTGLRESSRAIMLFGPPGTGKTLIGKCIASSCNATFMSVSASSLTSKWIGESETLVRAMFTYAKSMQPCVIFFDEIDSLLEKRSEQGNETFNRIKTEFLVQLDGANALKATDKVLLIGATNRPDVIDEAILRRFTKRILVPLPVKQARKNMITHLLSKHCHTLTDSQIDKLSDLSEHYSGSDIAQVCKEAAMMSIRRMDSATLESMKIDEIPPISPKDFLKALRNVKPTVSQSTIEKLEEWNEKYGSTVDDTDCTIDEGDFFDDDFEL